VAMEPGGQFSAIKGPYRRKFQLALFTAKNKGLAGLFHASERCQRTDKGGLACSGCMLTAQLAERTSGSERVSLEARLGHASRGVCGAPMKGAVASNRLPTLTRCQ
jgi:hypothetical protein